MIEQLLQFDTELFLYLNGLGVDAWDGFWMFYTTKFYWAPLYAFLLFHIYKLIGKRAFITSVVVIALMVLFTDQVTNLFKHGFKRFRPCHQEGVLEVMRLVKEHCGGQYGYFSGHSSNSMAVAIFSGLMLKPRFKYLVYILFAWSLAMGYSRIYIGVHYPLDVFCGLIFGGFSGYLFYRINQKAIKKFA
ncbi:MAG: phosphatase PAP2 family protein [Bacteroidetes bacterium MedPE-SWsnd-G2]|nr:MAG: phosphatase PAP2 family protein [Bacteroidetes bacterium MedPE-SWsnd-G2]